MHKPAAIDSAVLLASSVHDIKNSLGMLLQTLEELMSELELKDENQRRQFAILRGESARINSALISLLGVYRLREKQLPVKIEDVYVGDFLEDQVALNELLFDINGLSVNVDCDPDLVAYFDSALIAGVINNILVNASKYAEARIDMHARREGDELLIEISDDGPGYPQKMLTAQENHERGIDFSSGSTNLGLYFAAEIARLHRRGDRAGSIKLANPAEGGSLFTLRLPT